MSLERWIRLLGGAFVIVSVALGYLLSRYSPWFTMFVGANLFHSALTRCCLIEDILRRLGFPRHLELRPSSGREGEYRALHDGR